MSTVNVAEFCAKLNERQLSAGDVGEAVDDLGVTIEAFLRVDAETSGGWRRSTRPLGLGLGDRACLALAYRLSVPALTADSVWATLNVGVTVRLIREFPGE